MEVLTRGRVLRTVGALGLFLTLYKLFKRWRTRRVVKEKVLGKVVLVTGASSGLGEALARAYHSLGARVILAARSTHELERIRAQLDTAQSGESVKVLTLDLCESDSLNEKAQEAVDLFGCVDVLVNNAGISSRGAVLDTTIQTHRKVMEVNYFGTIAFTRGVVGAMVRAGGGHVVVVSSVQGRVGLPLRSSYAASKHALQGYFDSMRCELAPLGVRVTVVSPGYIRTQLSCNALAGDGNKHGQMDTKTARGMSADVVAMEIIKGVAYGYRDIVPANVTHKLAIYLNVLAPSLLDWILSFRQ